LLPLLLLLSICLAPNFGKPQSWKQPHARSPPSPTTTRLHSSSLNGSKSSTLQAPTTTTNFLRTATLLMDPCHLHRPTCSRLPSYQPCSQRNSTLHLPLQTKSSLSTTSSLQTLATRPKTSKNDELNSPQALLPIRLPARRGLPQSKICRTV
jgi:hypothetical protein